MAYPKSGTRDLGLLVGPETRDSSINWDPRRKVRYPLGGTRDPRRGLHLKSETRDPNVGTHDLEPGIHLMDGSWHSGP